MLDKPSSLFSAQCTHAHTQSQQSGSNTISTVVNRTCTRTHRLYSAESMVASTLLFVACTQPHTLSCIPHPLRYHCSCLQPDKQNHSHNHNNTYAHMHTHTQREMAYKQYIWTHSHSIHARANVYVLWCTSNLTSPTFNNYSTRGSACYQSRSAACILKSSERLYTIHIKPEQASSLKTPTNHNRVDTQFALQSKAVGPAYKDC